MWHGRRAQTHRFPSGYGLLSTLAGLRYALFGGVDWQVQLDGHRVDLREIESALGQRPDICECAVAPRPSKATGTELVAYVVPSNAVENTESLPYARVGGLADLACHVEGTITRQGGPGTTAHEIQESLDQTVERIRALRPARVLEIGCGTGQILFRVAPSCKEYVATEASAAALADIEQKLSSSWDETPPVILQQHADDFSGIAAASFDLVVINSVAQTFPNIQYLVSVLEKAVNATREGGVVFVGNIPNLPVLEATLVSGRSARPRLSMVEERELMIDPAFFDALARRTLGISHVEVALKRGHYTHEWSRCRYDVLLHVGEEAPEEVPVVWRRWVPGKHSVTSLSEICTKSGDIFAFLEVPNKRVCPDGVDPEAIWNFASAAGFEADITWSASGEKGAYDVVLRRGAMVQARAARALSEPMPWDAYANLPVRSGSRNVVISRWRQHLQQLLPAYMVPGEFVVVESLPRKASGEIDRRALRSKASAFPPAESDESLFRTVPEAQAPRSGETQIAKLTFL